MSEFDYGTGRRKNATARTRLYAGNGAIEVNGRKVEDYFPRKTLQMIIRQPLVLTKLVDKFDVKVNVCGGGVTGQAEAVRHGISRALLSADPSLSPDGTRRVINRAYEVMVALDENDNTRRSEARRVPDPRRP